MTDHSSRTKEGCTQKLNGDCYSPCTRSLKHVEGGHVIVPPNAAQKQIQDFPREGVCGQRGGGGGGGGR